MCVSVSLHVYVNFFFLFSAVCVCVYMLGSPRRCVSPVDQVTLGANCLSLRAQGWAPLIVLWPGTRCSYWCSSSTLLLRSSPSLSLFLSLALARNVWSRYLHFLFP